MVSRVPNSLWLALAVACYAMTLCAFLPLAPRDDAHIYLRILQNFEQGNGLYFNLGGTRNLASSPLYLLFLLIGQLFLSSSLAFCVTALISFSLLALSLFYFLTTSGVGLVCAAFASALIISFPYSLSLFGLETPLFVASALLALSLWERRAFVLASFVAGIHLAIRPEGLALVGVFGLVLFLRERKLPSLQNVMAFLFVPVLVFLVLFVLLGLPLPMTGAVKLAQGASKEWGSLLALVIEFVSIEASTPQIISLIAGVAAALYASISLWKSGSVAFFSLLPSALFILLFLNELGIAAYPWYLAPLVFAALCAAFTGIHQLSARFRGQYATFLFVALLCLPFLELSSRIEQRHLIPGEEFWVMKRAEYYRDIANVIDEIMEPDATLLAAEVGALASHLPSRTIYDSVGLLGLVSPEEVSQRDFGAWIPRAPKPDYVLIPEGFKRLVYATNKERFLERYKLVSDARLDSFERPFELFRRRAQPPSPEDSGL